MKDITINGVDYPAIFSLRVAIHTAKKWGSVQSIFDGTNEAENLEKRIWLLHELLVAGKVYAEKEDGVTSPEVPDIDTLTDTIVFSDVSALTLQLLEVVSGDQKVTIGAESKNAEATPAQ